MALDFIDVENFQRHEKQRVDFDPQLTTIVGQTDAGKSSLLRAVRWAALNQPDGDDMIRHESAGAVAMLGVDGRVITRRRMANGENKYYLDGVEFSAFGRGVPDRITDLLRVDKINFVGQKEPDFWFSLPPVEVARQLNSIVDLGVIDDAQETIGRKVRQCKEAVETAAIRLVEARKKREDLDWVGEADRALQGVEAAWEALSVVQGRHARLTALVGDIEKNEKTRDAARVWAEAISVVGRAGTACIRLGEQLDRLTSLIDDIVRIATDTKPLPDISTLENVLGQHQAAAGRLGRLTSLIADAERLSVSASTPPPDFGPVQAALDVLMAQQGRYSRLRALLLDVTVLEKTKMEWRDRVESFEAELETLSQGRCPMCGALAEDQQCAH